MKNTKMPNEGSSSGKGSSHGAKCGHNTGASTGLKMSNEKRGDVTAAVSNKQPYPQGLS